jgi:hypothetical protein
MLDCSTVFSRMTSQRSAQLKLSGIGQKKMVYREWRAPDWPLHLLPEIDFCLSYIINGSDIRIDAQVYAFFANGWLTG